MLNSNTTYIPDLETEHLAKETILQRKSLLTSLFYATLSNREMNFCAVRGLLSVFVAESITNMIRGLDADTSSTESTVAPIHCAGSQLTLNRSTSSVLCYCGRRFSRRLNSLKETWTIPRH